MPINFGREEALHGRGHPLPTWCVAISDIALGNQRVQRDSGAALRASRSRSFVNFGLIEIVEFEIDRWSIPIAILVATLGALNSYLLRR